MGKRISHPKKMGHTNGHLQQLAGASQRSQWIGWVIIAGLFSITLLLGSWIKTATDRQAMASQERVKKIESDHQIAIRELDVELKNLNLALITERGRINAQESQVATMIALSTRIEDFMRVLDNRLTRIEVQQEKRK